MIHLGGIACKKLQEMMLANPKRESAAPQMRTSVMPEAFTAAIPSRSELVPSRTINQSDEALLRGNMDRTIGLDRELSPAAFTTMLVNVPQPDAHLCAMASILDVLISSQGTLTISI